MKATNSQSQPVEPSSHRVGWIAAIILWSIAAVGVSAWWTDYEFSTYPATNSVVDRWPEDTTLVASEERSTLLLFLHPRCPCTRATIRQLQRVLEGSHVTIAQQPDVVVVVGHPAGADASWTASDTVRSSMQLPRARTFFDVDGVESQRFGATISGTVMLFATRGERLFAGGVTLSRGHEGDNLGATLLRDQLLAKGAPSKAFVPAFGCRLCLPESASELGSDRVEPSRDGQLSMKSK